jgi:imidazolonepropionase-like amidohydrolase/predicted thioesterase
MTRREGRVTLCALLAGSSGEIVEETNMKSTLAAGIRRTVRIEVDSSRAIGFLGEELRVYSTPSMVKDIEYTSLELIEAHLDPGESSVGIKVEVDHLAATPLGQWMDVEVEVVSVEGRKVALDAEVRDALETVGRGRHVRFVIDVARQAERLKAKLAKLAFVALLACTGAAPARAQSGTVVLENVRLFDGSGAPLLEEARIVVREGSIECAGRRESCPLPDGASPVDLAGKWVLPGLVDAHVHFSQTGWFDGRPDTLDLRDRFPHERVEAERKASPERFHRAYLCSGVTAVFDVGGYPWTWELREHAESETSAPHVAAAGPLVTHAPRELLNLPGEQQMLRLSSEAAGREAVRYMAAFGTDAIKVWFLRAPAGEEAAIDARVLAVGTEAASLGVPLIVHATSLREAKVALRAGAKLLVHGVDDAPLDDEFLELVREKNAIYTPTLVVSDGYLRSYEAVKGVAAPEIDDPNGCVDRATREKVLASGSLASHPSVRGFDRDLAEYRDRLARSYEVKVANLRKIYRAGLPIAVGTDAGNPGTLHGPSIYSELEAMQEAGIAPADLLVMATRNGARAMGRGDLGVLRAGNAADLIVLSRDPLADVRALRHLTHVMRSGKLMGIDTLSSR